MLGFCFGWPTNWDFRNGHFQSIPAVPIPLGISGAYFLVVRPGGWALVYPGAFDGLVFSTSKYCHFLSVVSSSGKDDKFVINFV